MERLVGYTLAGVLLISGCLLASVTYTRRHRITVLDRSIVRLHTADGRFFCSGVVITPNAIATAGHCVIVETPFGAMIDPDLKIEIRGADGLPTHIYARVGGVNPRIDTAMLLGDFHLFAHRDVIDSPSEIDRIFMNPESKIVACGYPLGGALTCSEVQKVRHAAFWYRAIGWLYPGMSGGPVIDLSSGKVIALNRAVDEADADGRTIILSPLAEFFEDMLPRS